MPMRCPRSQRGTVCAGGLKALTAMAVCSFVTSQAAAQSAGNAGALAGLSLQQLSGLAVTSVSKASEPLNRAPAAIYVITHDDIVQSGATTIPQALRLAPNLLVTQLSSNNFSISARGFGGNVPDQNYSNKLLILIDGRTVYSPLYSGVYLDVQDALLSDVDRIEVISGPGATLWGANAMNGVINIITRNAEATRGVFAEAAGGNLEQTLSARYGASLGDEAALRIYGKAFQQGAEIQPDGFDPHDSWNKWQGGFRLDWSRAADAVTLQGDGYRGSEHQDAIPATAVLGGDVLARWQRISGATQWQVQTYFDQTERIASGGAPAFTLHTYDLELQQTIALGSTRIVWGAGERVNDYTIAGTPSFQFVPQSRALTLGNVFAQGTLPLLSSLNMTVGLKLEDDPYAGWQVLPDLRFAAPLTSRLLLWAAFSRAVRSPTPFDVDVREYAPPVVQLVGDGAFRPEELWNQEIGTRFEPLAVLSLSASVFYSEYSDLRTVQFGPPAALPLSLTWGNSERGRTYGFGAWADWQVTPWWRLSPGLRALHENFSFVPGVAEVLGLTQAGDDPSMQGTLISSMQLPWRVMLYGEWRYVGALPSPALPAYNELNARLAWRALSKLELALIGDNLLHARHLEYPLPYGEYIDRSVMLQVRYNPQ